MLAVKNQSSYDLQIQQATTQWCMHMSI